MGRNDHRAPPAVRSRAGATARTLTGGFLGVALALGAAALLEARVPPAPAPCGRAAP